MRRAGRWLVVGWLLLGGCAAQQALDRGNAARQAGRYTAALHEYETALHHDRSLKRNAEFVRAYHELQWRSAYEEGRKKLARQSFEAAITDLQRCLALNPGYGPAQDALRQAKQGAARRHYRRALTHADSGDLEQARLALDQVIGFDPEHQKGRVAMESLEERAIAAPASSTLQEADKLSAERRWRDAAHRYRAAIEIDPDYLPARAALDRAERELSRSAEQHELAKRWLNEKHLDRAIGALRRAMEIWPFNGAAADLLEETTLQRRRVEEDVMEAERFAAEENWDQAIILYRRALASFPQHERAGRDLKRTRGIAAESNRSQGDALLQDGRFAEAEAAYRRALGYRPGHASARSGLARVDFARARAAEGAGYPGAALLHAMNAADDEPTGPYLAHAQRLKALLGHRARYRIHTQVRADHEDLSPLAGALHAAVDRRLAAHRPPHVDLTAAPTAETDAPTYTAVTAVKRLHIGSRRLRTDPQSHPYTVYRSIPNPALPHLRHELHEARHRLQELKHRHRHEHRAHHDHADRDHHHKDEHASPGPRHRSRRSVPHGVIRRAEKRIRHLEHELACAPAFIRKAYPAVWHYQVEHHEAHGRLDLRIELIEPVRGDTVEAFGVEAETSHHDSTVLRPNPEIGLAADPLMLPDRDRITADLVESAAERAAGRLIAAVARAHADHWLRIAAGHADLGDAAAATEARVAAAVVLEPSDPNRAQRMLDELR